MALPATDEFTDTNGVALTTHSTSWTSVSGAYDIQSNRVHPNAAATHNVAAWNADTFSPNQYAQMTITGIGAALGVAVRCSLSADTQYSFTVDDVSRISIFRYLAGAAVRIATSTANAPQANDILRVEITGATLTGKVNGVVRLTVDDANITSGYAGIAGSGNLAGVHGDNWVGGNMPSILTTHQWSRTAKHHRRER